ncbi:MAG: ribosome assembly RNA-binding protein YhbY [Deltaproteobacteria bacterium]|nr:ribosome assembly RNA-binding protein YhbY [Deltaproteobacteria bacterium]
MQLKGSQKKYLRGMAHNLRPVVMVGKNGVTNDLIGAVIQALDSQELIKVKFIDYKEKKKALSNDIEQRAGAELVGMIGNIAILYRQHPDTDKRKISLP